MNRFRHSPTHAALRSFLSNARKEKELLQSTLATKLQKPQSYVSKYENGEKNLDLIEILEIIEALEINPKEFFEAYLKEYKKIKDQRNG